MSDERNGHPKPATASWPAQGENENTPAAEVGAASDRAAAGQLREIAGLLGVPPSYFHERVTVGLAGPARDQEREAERQRLCAAFERITDSVTRELLVALAESLAVDASTEPKPPA